MSENQFAQHDLDVKNYFESHECITSKPWSKSQLKDLTSAENPYCDKKALNSHLPEHPSVSILSEHAKEFVFEHVKYVPDQYNKKSNPTFRSELSQQEIDKLPEAGLSTDASSAIAETREDEDKDFYELLSYEAPSFTPAPEEPYLCLEYNSCKLGFDLIEPLVFSTFVLDNGKIVTETWNHFDPSFRTYGVFGNPDAKQAAFNIRNHSENAYLVTVVNRCFLPDNGDDINKYYRKPTPQLKDKALKLFTPLYNKFKGKWNTFGFTFYPLSKIPEGGDEITMPKVYLYENQSKALTADYLAQQIERAINGKVDQIPIDIKYNAGVANIGNPNNAFEGGLVFHSSQPHNLCPITLYQNQLLLNLNQATFTLPSKVVARNIIAEIQVIHDGKPLKCIRSRWEEEELTDTAYSRVLYHEKNPSFEDQFIIELPTPCDGLIIIRFFNLGTKPNEPPMTFFANASFEISAKHDQFVRKDGIHRLNIIYKDQPQPGSKSTRDNQCIVTTLLHSSLVTNVLPLKPVFNQENELPQIDKIPEKNLIYSLYQVIDSVLTNISVNPLLAVRNLISMDRLTSVISPDDLQRYLMNYALELAFREGTKHDPKTHNYILREWAKIIKELSNVIGAERKDLIVMPFLFQLVLKSLLISKDDNFQNDLNVFSQEWSSSIRQLSEKGYQQAQRMNKSFAQFTSSLTDIGLYSAASICVVNYVNAFGDSGTEHKVILNFLEQALNPRLFIAETLVENKFVPIFNKIFKTANGKSPMDPIKQIYVVFARALAFVPLELKPQLAARLSPLLLTYDTKIQGTPDQLAGPLSLVSFILKYINCNDFAEFFTKLDEKQQANLIEFIHFYAVNAKYTKESYSQGPATANTAALSSLEKQFQSVGGGNPFGSVKGRQALKAGKRNFAKINRNSFNPYAVQQSSYRPNKDLALESQFALINTINNMLNMEQPNYLIANDLLFHVLSMNLAIESIDKLVEAITLFIKKDVKFLVECRAPPFVLILKKILSLMACKNRYVSQKVATVLPVLFRAERAVFPTNNRTLVQITRAISLLDVKDATSPVLIESIQKLLVAPTVKEEQQETKKSSSSSSDEEQQQHDENENKEEQPQQEEQPQEEKKSSSSSSSSDEEHKEENNNEEQPQQEENNNNEEQPQENNAPEEQPQQEENNNPEEQPQENNSTEEQPHENEPENNAESEEKESIQKILDLITRLSQIYNRLRTIDPEGFKATFKQNSNDVVVPKAKQNSEMDEYGDLLWERACLFRLSPDATSDALRILEEFHAANDYKIESIITKIVRCALISEYLTLLSLMPKVFGESHAALAFNSLTPICGGMIAPQHIIDDIPNVPGFCDSPIFCESGLISILYEISDYCQTEQLFEIINQTLLVFVPLFEYHEMFEELESLFAKSQEYYQFLDSTPKMGERLMGKYYRVCFFGECFGEYNKHMYIYRETKLTNLFNLTNRLEATYSPLLPPGKLEIIKESGAVDTRLLDPDKGYIQITFVNPTSDKKEAYMRQTTFEINSHVNKFYFETPFMKGSKKLQGSVENQWLRRTFLNVRDEMPNVVKRVTLRPDDIVNVEYEPIRVSCRQLKERLAAYELAIQTKSISQIQPLLNGSLCVQVNEGPTKMAEVFLGGNLRTKYTEKMRSIFRKFLELNAVALEIHREASKDNPNFQALQEQMDIGFKDLKAKLEPYLNAK